MGLLRVMMPPKLQLLALLAFAVAMFFLENQIQKLEESRGKLGKFKRLQLAAVQGHRGLCVRSVAWVNINLCITIVVRLESIRGSMLR